MLEVEERCWSPLDWAEDTRMGILRDMLRRCARLGMRLGVDSRGLALLAFSSSSPPLALSRARSVTGVDLLMVMGDADSIEFLGRCL